MPDFQPFEMVRVLNEHRVDYVCIGGLAAQLQGSPLPTSDLDVTPDMAMGNLTRLSSALTAMHARIRHPDVPEGLALNHDATSLAAAIFWNLVTDFGDLDLSFHPAGTEGFADLFESRLLVRISGIDVPLAALADIIRSKDAANRDKDRRALPILRRLLDDATEAARNKS